MDLKPTFNIRLILLVVSSNCRYILDITRELADNPEKIMRSSFNWLVEKNQQNKAGNIRTNKPQKRDKVAYEITYDNRGTGILMGERYLKIEIDCRITENYLNQFKERIRREKLNSILSANFLNGDIMIEAIQIVGEDPPCYKIFGTSTEILD